MLSAPCPQWRLQPREFPWSFAARAAACPQAPRQARRRVGLEVVDRAAWGLQREATGLCSCGLHLIGECGWGVQHGEEMQHYEECSEKWGVLGGVGGSTCSKPLRLIFRSCSVAGGSASKEAGDLRLSLVRSAPDSTRSDAELHVSERMLLDLRSPSSSSDTLSSACPWEGDTLRAASGEQLRRPEARPWPCTA